MLVRTVRSCVTQTIIRHTRNATIRPSSNILFQSTNRSLYTRTQQFAPTSIVVPSMGDSISEGTLNSVVADVGVGVNVDDVVAKLDTDKVSVDIRSTVAGTVSKWHAKVGDTVKVGAPLLEVEAGAGATVKTPSNVKQPQPILTPAAKPDADVGEKSPAPIAQSGMQAPQSIHPTDPHDSPHRVPLIHFRFGKRDASGSAGAHRQVGHQHQGNQTVEVTGGDFLTANEAAAAAYDALPARYKKKPLKQAQLDIIELGGAANYEPKKKVRT